jgi:diphosphomevalonate decarboxylase
MNESQNGPTAAGKATARAGANIAFVKYWGQADPALNLPLNNSLSLTLDAAFSVTTVEFVPGLAADSLVLNDQPAGDAATRRVALQLDRLRALAVSLGNDRAPSASLRARVASRNSFPTGAGIASSASGFAALTVAAAAALGLALSTEALSVVARLASGSACRSLHGGYVEWLAGSGYAADASRTSAPRAQDGSGADAPRTADRGPEHEWRESSALAGSHPAPGLPDLAWDSHAVQVAPPDYWQLMDVVAVVSQEAKEVPSESGHRLALSSPFLAARLATVPESLAVCRAAILARDLAALGEAAEADALSLHAVALTSRPSVWYWNCGTQAVVEAVGAWRRDGLPAYFTIDAGPNVHILTLPAHLPAVLERLQRISAVEQVIVCGPGPGATLIDQHLF